MCGKEFCIYMKHALVVRKSVKIQFFSNYNNRTVHSNCNTKEAVV